MSDWSIGSSSQGGASPGAPGGRVAAAAGFVATLAGGPAFAHGSERALVLLLPSGPAIMGGALAVALTAAGLAWSPARLLRAIAAGEWRIAGGPSGAAAPVGGPREPGGPRVVSSLASALFLALLVATGALSTADPLRNPLPLVVWTLFWVALPQVQALTGNLWPWLNPWTGPLHLVARASGGRLGAAPLIALPERLGLWPAVLVFLGFAWVEIVSLAPDDPPRLARLVALYWAGTFAAMILFGATDWGAAGEPFGLLFGLIGGLSPFRFRAGRPLLVWPGRALWEAAALPFSGVVFVTLVLGSASFDGIAESFVWLAAIGINPLDFPGRSAVSGPNTLGLIAMPLAILGLFAGAVMLGARLAERARPDHGERRPDAAAPARQGSTKATPGAGKAVPGAGRTAPGQGARQDAGPRRAALLGRLVLSLLPIAMAFHFAHYLTFLLMNAQWLIVAASDPFTRGWNLFGTADWHVTASVFADPGRVWLIWTVQTGAVVAGHLLALVIAHMIALDHFGDARRAALSQAPLACLMVGYTVFGLWLLSAPMIG